MKKIICLIVLILFISICMVSCSSYNQTGTDSYTRSTLTSYSLLNFVFAIAGPKYPTPSAVDSPSIFYHTTRVRVK